MKLNQNQTDHYILVPFWVECGQSLFEVKVMELIYRVINEEKEDDENSK